MIEDTSEDDYLAELRQSNSERLASLAQDGYGLDPFEQLTERLDLLTNSVIGGLAALGGRDPETLERSFEIAWEEGCAERILDLEAVRNQAKLAATNGHGEQLSIADIE